MIKFEDKKTIITNTKKQVARKTLAHRTTEHRGTLKPLWKINPDNKIKSYSPTTITLDTNNRKNTVIRKNDLTIVNESKPRLIHLVACKTVREYNRNQEKIKEFSLTEKKIKHNINNYQPNQPKEHHPNWTNLHPAQVPNGPNRPKSHGHRRKHSHQKENAQLQPSGPPTQTKISNNVQKKRR